MSLQCFTHEIVELPGGLKLEASLACPLRHYQENKLAVCLHPWSWLGGSMDDPVLSMVEEPLLELGFHVIRYNSRGVGRSSGWPSFTGSKEGEDLRTLVNWALSQIPDVKSVVIFGYSHGSLITSTFPILPEPIKTSHILLSYPLGPRSWLTAFSGRSYTATLNTLLRDPRANVLVIYGDRDEFTAVDNYERWADGLRKESEDSRTRTLEIIRVEDASHFWGGSVGRTMIEAVRNWLS